MLCVRDQFLVCSADHSSRDRTHATQLQPHSTSLVYYHIDTLDTRRSSLPYYFARNLYPFLSQGDSLGMENNQPP